jgi:hypothetical protein
MAEFMPASQPRPEPVPHFGAAPPVERPKWPKVIGIISIVWASLGLFCTCISIPMNVMNPNAQQAMDAFPSWWPAYQVGSGVAWMALNALLLVAGINLVRYRPSGATLHPVYAVISLVISVVNMAITVPAMTTAMEKLAQGPTAEVVKPMMIVGAVVGFAFSLAYPVFVLIWFARGQVRRQVRDMRWAEGNIYQAPQ